MPATSRVARKLQENAHDQHRTEWHRSWGKEMVRKRKSFNANPFDFRKLLGDKRSGRSGRVILTPSFATPWVIPAREQVLSQKKQLSWTSRIQAWKRSRKSLRQQDQPLPLDQEGYRTACTNAVQDSVQQLWKILRVMWQRGRVTNQCRCAEGIWIPKEENFRDTNPFRTMSLLSIEGNIFFQHLVPEAVRFPCKERLHWHVCYRKSDLWNTWLLGAQGLMGTGTYERSNECLCVHTPQAGWRDSVLSKMKNLILDYHNNFQMRVTSGSSTSEWHRL